MTAIIGFNLGACALLLADTRKGVFHGGAEPQDGDQKLLQVGFGMVSGAGSPAMIRAVVDKVRKLNLTPADIPWLMRRYRERVAVDHPDLEETAINSLEQTRMIATSVERPPSGLAVSKIVVFVPVGGGNFGRDEIGLGSATICGPTPDAAWDTWMARCRAHLEVPQTVRMQRDHQPEELVATIAANIRLAAEVMVEIAASTPAVSPSFTIGVQYSPNDIRISGPHEAPPDLDWLR